MSACACGHDQRVDGDAVAEDLARALPVLLLASCSHEVERMHGDVKLSPAAIQEIEFNFAALKPYLRA